MKTNPSGNMFPSRSSDYFGGHRFTYSEFPRDLRALSSRGNQLSQFFDFFRIHFRWATQLLYAINLILFIGAQEKMVRANAERLIAFMADIKIWWNRAKMQLPRNAMSFAHAKPWSQLDLPISSSSKAGGPQPAGISLVYMLPEPFRKWDTRSFGRAEIAFSAAVFSHRVRGGYEGAFAY